MDPIVKNLVLASAAGVIVVAIYYYLSRRREPFKVVGGMGPYKDLYYKCSSDCERSDPGKQLSPTHGNMMCQEYCDSVITDIARRGGPSYPLDARVATPPLSGGISTSVDDAFAVCGDGGENAWCRDKYFTATEIDSKCQQDCEYSTYPTKTCMDLCAKSKKGNFSRGWTWK